MKRVWIQMPEDLHTAAEKKRIKQYLPSFTEYVRQLIVKDLLGGKGTEEEEGIDVKALAQKLSEE